MVLLYFTYRSVLRDYTSINEINAYHIIPFCLFVKYPPHDLVVGVQGMHLSSTHTRISLFGTG